MSGLLTTTIPKMGDTVKLLEAEGLREGVKVVCGGAPVTQAFVDSIGADGYGTNAAAAVELAKQLVQ
jgi:5-methyltetrahydrofolate--homocysteine methyltransferase